MDALGAAAVGTVNVTVQQTPATITVTPGAAVVLTGATQQFNATEFHQFGDPMNTQPTFAWSNAYSYGEGATESITPSGLYSNTAPYFYYESISDDEVVASADGEVGFADVNLDGHIAISDFSGLPIGTVITNQLGWAQFSTLSGATVVTTSDATIVSSSKTMFVDFPIPVNFLMLDAFTDVRLTYGTTVAVYGQNGEHGIMVVRRPR